MQFKELTTWQREPLFHLVALQQKEQRQITFSFWDGSSEVSYYPSNEKASHMAAEAGLETIGLWEKEGYVHTKTIVQKGPQTISTYILQERSERGTFILLQQAFDYAAFMQKPRWQRGIIRFGHWMTSDIPAFLWGIVGAVIVQLIPPVTKWLQALFS